MSRRSLSYVIALTLVTFGQIPSSIDVAAEELRFRTHELNAASEFTACAIFDIDGDGKRDIACGGWWYRAPSWERTFLRDVEEIRGRFDDYSNLVLDVNGDGRQDLVSVNYRSKSLYWVENPSGAKGVWKKHLIDTPGPMETGRLVDVDGDGKLDVLPNGTDFAAWWELARTSDGASQWIRHDLPSDIAGHGIGFGDVNGDGRGDIIGRSGWLEAPLDRRTQKWTWHPDFYLDRDTSIPILVHDVDGDGDGDLIWGRGHSFGVYWMEQVRNGAAPVKWERHAIDTSWAQAHSLLLADLDRDGRVELITGKRYMGHEGKDLGEYDPLGIYAYTFDKTHRTWKRETISTHSRAGFGLDPKVEDIDGDGDLDIASGDRHGLYWFENLLIQKEKGKESVPAAVSQDPSQLAGKYSDHSRLLKVVGADRQLHDVDTPSTWGTRRSHILECMQRVMGPLPDSSRRVPLEVQVVNEEDAGKYVRKKITFATEPGDRVPAYLLVPKQLTGRAAAVLCLHQTTMIGKGEPAAIGGLKTLHYAHELAERRNVCLVPDYPSFGDYPYDFKKQGSHFASGSMKAIWNNIRAVDLLEGLPEVDHDRIGVIGHSLGGHNSLFTAAFDQRIKCVATSCGFTAFHHYYSGKLAGWTSDRYMPRIRDVYENNPDRMPFDFYEVLGAIAPRGIYVNAPLHDSNFENVGVKKVMTEVEHVYELLGSKDRLVGAYPDVGHDFPDHIRQQCYSQFDKWLK